MTLYNFDDNNIRWYTLDGFDHLYCHILAIDEPNKIVDVLFRFTSNEQIVLHRHKVLNTTFVVQGEHRLYRANGEIKDIRAVGSFTVSPPDDEPHREGGGDGQDVIVLFSIRGSDGVLYEILDDAQNQIAALGFQDFIGLYQSSS